MKKVFLFWVALTGVAWAQVQKGAELPRGVSLVHLIATPEKYNGRRVMLIGVLALDNEGDAVYLSYEDYSHAMRYNRVKIERNKTVNTDCAEADGRYVVVAGEFEAPGPTEDSTGRIKNISRCSLWSSSSSSPPRRP
jgi:hypothetical protein